MNWWEWLWLTLIMGFFGHDMLQAAKVIAFSIASLKTSENPHNNTT